MFPAFVKPNVTVKTGLVVVIVVASWVLTILNPQRLVGIMKKSPDTCCNSNGLKVELVVAVPPAGANGLMVIVV